MSQAEGQKIPPQTALNILVAASAEYKGNRQEHESIKAAIQTIAALIAPPEAPKAEVPAAPAPEAPAAAS